MKTVAIWIIYMETSTYKDNKKGAELIKLAHNHALQSVVCEVYNTQLVIWQVDK